MGKGESMERSHRKGWELPKAAGIRKPLDLVTKVVRGFRPPQRLKGEQSEIKPNEAVFQDEFYRACHVVTNRGPLATLQLQFGSKAGRIGFY